jgi:hypothetical protein
LHDLKVDVAFSEVVGLVDSKPDGDRLNVVPGYFMFFDRFDEGDVVEVDDLGLLVAISRGGVADWYTP